MIRVFLAVVDIGHGQRLVVSSVRFAKERVLRVGMRLEKRRKSKFTDLADGDRPHI